MQNPLSRLEDYRNLAQKHRRLASNDSSKETRSYHLYVAKNFRALVAARHLKSP